MLTFLVTAVLVSLLTLLLTWCLCVRAREKKGGAPIAPDPVYLVPMCTVTPPEDSGKIYAAMGYEYMQHQTSTTTPAPVIYDTVDDN